MSNKNSLEPREVETIGVRLWPSINYANPNNKDWYQIMAKFTDHLIVPDLCTLATTRYYNIIEVLMNFR